MPPLLTNQLLERLMDRLDASTAASTNATDIGIPASPAVPFYRMGEPFRIPVSPTSGNDPFPSSGTLTLPPNVNCFLVTNLNPFPVRLRGTRDGQTFNPVTATTGWVFMPGVSGPFTTVAPIKMAVVSVDGPFAASDPTQKAGSGWVELQYGAGSF